MKWIRFEERKPPESGIYPAFSITEGRTFPKDWQDSLCYFNAEAEKGKSKWQHSSGFYDNGITHWLELTEPTTTEEIWAL